MADNYITIAEASAVSGYTREYLRLLARSKRIPSKKVGPIVLVSLPHLEKHKQNKDAVRAAYKEGKE